MRRKTFLISFFTISFILAGALLSPRESRSVVAVFENVLQWFIPTIPGQPIKVASVIDGDTVELINGDHLRFIGIDTPESLDPRKPVQCFSHEATAANRALVEGKTITFYPDVSLRDKYNRWLGFVYLEDGTFVNKKLILDGFAFSYPYKPDTSKDAELNEAEAFAHQNKRGLWAACEVTKLSSGRKQTNDTNEQR